ncbi:MAG: sugar phosphate isomerase/epimerase [Thermogutta sp.]|nr:sugar phosphate isomerase/epimerase [Thermogutta sp.]
MSSRYSRRSFIVTTGLASCAALAAGRAAWGSPGEKMRLGLVTYLWGRDWDLPTLIANCEKTGMEGVELRTQHAHRVEPNLSADERANVRKRFADSPVVLVGLGTNQAYHYPDPAVLRKSIEDTKAFIKLSHDVGGLGVKVKPNDLPKNVPPEKTIVQIGEALNEVAAFGADYGQRIRLEVHGGCAPLPIMKKIMDVAAHPNVGVCWNSNAEDLRGEGLVHNFNLVKDRLADTVHVRELNLGDYPFQELMDLLVGMDYAGWILLECRTEPPDRVAALKEQREVWRRMIAAAQAKVAS